MCFNNNLVNEVVNGLTQLSSNNALRIIESAQVHSFEIANPELIEVSPQKENIKTNDEQIDANVNVNNSFAEISSLELVTASTNTLSTNTNGEMIATTNDNRRHISQVNSPVTRQFSASNDGDLEDAYDSYGELGPFYDAVDGIVEILEDEKFTSNL